MATNRWEFMETNKIISERQISETTEMFGRIFRSNSDKLFVEMREDCYDITYRYGDYLIIVSKEFEIRYQYYYFEINIKFTKESISSPTPFWHLLAIYDNERYNMSYRKEIFEKYLLKLKEYLDQDRFFYDATDIAHRKRYFVFEGVRKELPYIMNLDTEDLLRFGERAARIKNNRPIENSEQ